MAPHYYAWINEVGLLQDYLGSGRVFRRATVGDKRRSNRERAMGNPSGGFVVDSDGVPARGITW